METMSLKDARVLKARSGKELAALADKRARQRLRLPSFCIDARILIKAGKRQ